MTLSHSKPFKNIRIVNFCNIDLTVSNILNLGMESVEKAADSLRSYADLPTVYIVSREHSAFLLKLLDHLKAIRSSSYPHALFFIDGPIKDFDPEDIAVIPIGSKDLSHIQDKIKEWSLNRFCFDHNLLKIEHQNLLPPQVDVLIIGAGVTGLYAARKLTERNISVSVVDKRDRIGGIWSDYANETSQVNTSESAYRSIEDKIRSNRDHSPTREILEDMVQLTQTFSDSLFLNTQATLIEKTGSGYETTLSKNGKTERIQSKGVILAINDRVGTPRGIEWPDQHTFQGEVVSGMSDGARGVQWKDKQVVIIGMGAFAIENARTALENGAAHVSVVCRRHGTVCPKIIDYLNFATPYDDEFKHDKKSNMRNMMYWKKLYTLSAATQPECWMGKIKHEGHTISVSDIWFIGHYLKKLATHTGSVTGLFKDGVIVNNDKRIRADVVVNCIGFHKNASLAKEISNYSESYNNNYLDKDLMYLADAYIDDDVFNSFFGSSVLEMTKFYLNVFVKFFNSPEFDEMIISNGIIKFPIEERSWSHYINGATSLMENYPDIRQIALDQVNQRTHHFLQAHDLETYIRQNKREWIQTHEMLLGKPMSEEACLPYVFGHLIKKK